ncbi:hypothetical protein ACIQVN_05415 [Streptomyces cyaneofuscatus]|uniref:hypothetical protein n=1 Tax=Streptomyces cyaneofuscatus TaxID=66883 RepID=UPI003804D07E
MRAVGARSMMPSGVTGRRRTAGDAPSGRHGTGIGIGIGIGIGTHAQEVGADVPSPGARH